MSAFLNGEFMALADCRVSVLDRGFLFGDGVYELIPVYGGHLFHIDKHLARLAISLEAVGIANPYLHDEWVAILTTLIERSDHGDLTLYLQLTRGVAPRDHAFPQGVKPTVFAMAQSLRPLPASSLREGVRAITLEDIRWSRCDIKAVSLLANVLARQHALGQGAAEAILIRDGYALEGAASNLFIVYDDTVMTPPNGPGLLPGVTRDVVLELIVQHGLAYREAAIPADLLAGAGEVWLTSSSKEIMPVVELDGRPVGSGQPGPVWTQAYHWLQAYKDSARREAQSLPERS